MSSITDSRASGGASQWYTNEAALAARMYVLALNRILYQAEERERPPIRALMGAVAMAPGCPINIMAARHGVMEMENELRSNRLMLSNSLTATRPIMNMSRPGSATNS